MPLGCDSSARRWRPRGFASLFWRRFEAVNKQGADKSFFKSSFFLCGRSLTPPQRRLARLRRQSERGGGRVFFKAALISASLLLPQRKFCFSPRLHLPLAVVSYSHTRRWRRRRQQRHLLFPVFSTPTFFSITTLQGHTDFCACPRTVNVGLESIRPSQDASIDPTPSPPAPSLWDGARGVEGGGWRTSGIPGGPAPSIQVPVSRKPRASPAPAKRRRSLSAPSTSLYGPHSPQSKAATELTSQDGGYCRSSNLPNCVPSSSPCQPPPSPPQRALILHGGPSCPGSRGEASSRGPRCGQTVGGLCPPLHSRHTGFRFSGRKFSPAASTVSTGAH